MNYVNPSRNERRVIDGLDMERLRARKNLLGPPKGLSESEREEIALRKHRGLPPRNIIEATQYECGSPAQQLCEWYPKPCVEPTKARPGSIEKLAVLVDRVAHGEELWAEGDLTEWSDESEFETALT